jgi:hypothetical protein
MKPYMTTIIGYALLGAKILALLSASWAPSITTTYGNTIRRYFDFGDEHMLATLAATPAHTAQYVAWLGQIGAIKAPSLQPYRAVSFFVEGCKGIMGIFVVFKTIVGSQRLFQRPPPRSNCHGRRRR